MKKVLEFIKTNKRMIIIIGGVAIGLVIFILGLLMLFGQNNKEKELKSLLEEMGKDFYENYFYDGLNKTEEEKINFLKGYSDKGLKVTLESFNRFNSKVNESKLKEFVNPDTNKPCNQDESIVTIYPKSNYGKKDYDVKVTLVCGFKSEK